MKKKPAKFLFEMPKYGSYEWNEFASAGKKLDEVKRAPLADRKEAAKEFGEALKDPELIAERLSWLFAGNYGYGEMLKAKQVLGVSANANKPANLNMLVAAYEWQCPADLAIKAWKALTPAQKKKLDTAIKRVMKRAEKSDA